MPGVLLPVQLPEDKHRPVSCMDVEHSVHVCAPINGVPAENTHRERLLNACEVWRVPRARDTGSGRICRAAQV